MATNSGRGNIIDAADAPRGGDTDPPPVSNEVKGAVAKEASTSVAGSSSTGVHASGQEPGMQPDPTPKVEVPKDRERA
ncbi:hypothetical protein EV127DRAFT_510174 [Xylaria flabelliformis]|nr:hypothetical protein EV127DRAFT_510174 [Xylaria flabelliformis]KAI0855406.1 hypothetical protein F4860DRAFT_38331 [Xylaria cubensis]